MREGRTFQDIFDDLAETLDYAPAEVSGDATLQAKVLKRLNWAARDVWERRAWEDAWQDAALTPASGLLTFTQVEDARYFQFWSADPRVVSSGAYQVPCVVSADGITLNDATLTSVFAFWLSKPPQFNTTAWLTATAYVVGDLRVQNRVCYKCLIAHTSGTFATDLAAAKWVAVNLPTSLCDAVVELAAARHEIAAGDYGKGNARMTFAQQRIERMGQIEYGRLARAGERAWMNVSCCFCNPN